MTVRPHCLQCGSTNVILDEDVLNGRLSIYCAICGNRQYRETDYVGFEMREETRTMRGTCKNCKREGLHIVSRGFCFVCRKALMKNPEPGHEQERALKKAADRAKSLPGPRTRKANPPAARRKIDPFPYPDKQPSDRPVEKELRQGFQERLDALPDRQNPDIEQVTVLVRFAGPDLPLFRAFKEYSAKNRRDPENQVLSMIENLLVEKNIPIKSRGAQP